MNRVFHFRTDAPLARASRFKSVVVTAVIAALSVTVVTAAAKAADSDASGASAWSCAPGSYFQVINGRLSTSTNLVAWHTVGPKGSVVNALGYSPETQYLYAIVSATGSHGATLVKIGSGGLRTTLGVVHGLPANKIWKGGDVDPSTGLYYVGTGTNLLYAINVNTLTATAVTVPSTMTLGYDLVVENGWLWTATTHVISGLDLLSGATKNFAIPSIDSGDAAGSMWSSLVSDTVYLRWDHSRQVFAVGGLTSSAITFTHVTRSTVDGGVANDGATCTVAVAPSSDDAPQLHITGNTTAAWYPGLAQRINLQFENTYTVPVTIPASDIRVSVSDSASACPTATNFLVTQGVPIELTIPANSTTTLSSLGVPVTDWPHVEMVETHENQDGCWGSSLSFAYSFRYHS